jgi:hypothetical protein
MEKTAEELQRERQEARAAVEGSKAQTKVSHRKLNQVKVRQRASHPLPSRSPEL